MGEDEKDRHEDQVQNVEPIHEEDTLNVTLPAIGNSHGDKVETLSEQPPTASSTMSTQIPTIESPMTTVDTIDSHAYVDLGLSVRWATCNVGANSPEECGDYYAWGETFTKTSYESGNSETWGKDVDDIARTSRDVARTKWGGNWRMPTKADFDELLDNCIWEFVTLNGVMGYKVTSKKNGKSIFLPAAGLRDGASSIYSGQDAYYWSSTPTKDNTLGAIHLVYNHNYNNRFDARRYYGHTVRPVME